MRFAFAEPGNDQPNQGLETPLHSFPQMSLFKRQLPSKRLNAKGNSELRPISGSLSYDSDQLHQFSEGFEDYRMGTNGLRDNPQVTQRVASSDGEMRFAEMVDAPTSRVRYEPEAKHLVSMFAEQVETHDGFSFAEGTVRKLQSFFSNKQHQNVANELHRLNNQDTPLTIEQRTRRMNLQRKTIEMRSELKQICRAS